MSRKKILVCLISLLVIGCLILFLVSYHREQKALINKLKRKLKTDKFSNLILRNETSPEPNDYKIYFPKDKNNLLQTIDTIFAKKQNLSSKEKCVEILRFVSSHIGIGEHHGFEPSSNIIKNQIASCGGFAMVFCDLVRCLDLPARYLGVFGMPKTGSHALTEVYYDNSWHLFDPTFGVFFYSKKQYGSGHIYSAQKIFTLSLPPIMMQVVYKPWQKNYSKERNYGIKPINDKPTSHVKKYWNERNRRVAFPLAFGNNSVVSYPVHINLIDSQQFLLGKEDNSWQDVYKECYKNPNNGYFILGGTCPTGIHTLDIQTVSRAIVEITYKATKESTGDLHFFPLSAAHLLEKNNLD